ncbi:MAG: PAS domain-containing sensor histidine kinase [Verrucomicrobia bacterium]|nr:PAS domain-containing sensor histidine kinase [Verrucomicrobiota bacterium]
MAEFTILNEKIQELTGKIRQRVAVEEALRQSESLFRELADAMPQIVWASRPDGTLDYYNRRWYELTGTREGDFGDQSWLPILHPDDRQRTLDSWYDSVRTGRDYQIEYRFKFPGENNYRWHLGRALCIRDAERNIIRWFGTSTDIDHQKLAEERLEGAVAERTASLQEAIAQLEEFSYSVSHDLRAPVRAMRGYGQTLLADYAERLDEEGRNFLSKIVRAGERMDKLILDVLTFSKVARAEMELQTVCLTKLVHEVIEQYPDLQSSEAEIEVSPLPSVIGHEPSLTQAISNLLTNATKFVPDGVTPKVRIHAQTEGSHVRVWFEDNGIGIPPEYQGKIFGMFERIHPENKYSGTGIGLAIVSRALKRMDGQVGVESDGVNGSKFWIRLRAGESL